jgi:hypothetical protein
MAGPCTYVPDAAWALKYDELPKVPTKMRERLRKSLRRPEEIFLNGPHTDKRVLDSLEHTFARHGQWDEEHKPSAKAMSLAGFLYRPVLQKGLTDNARCYSCGVELSSWKIDDDPLEEHRLACQRKGIDCFFLNSNPTSVVKLYVFFASIVTKWLERIF